MATAEFSKFAGIFSIALSQYYLLGLDKIHYKKKKKKTLKKKKKKENSWNSIISTSFVHSDTS